MSILLTHIHARTYMHTDTWTFIHAHTYMDIHTCTHIHAHTYMDIHTCTHIHTVWGWFQQKCVKSCILLSNAQNSWISYWSLSMRNYEMECVIEGPLSSMVILWFLTLFDPGNQRISHKWIMKHQTIICIMQNVSRLIIIYLS